MWEREYVDRGCEAEVVGVALVGGKGAEDEIGIDLDLVVVAEVFDEPVAELPAGVVDEHLVLVRLRDGRNVLLLRHQLQK